MGKKIDLDKFKDGLESTVVHHPRLSSILVSNGRKKPIWVRTKLVINEHIVVPDMNSGTATPPNKLVDYVSSLSTSPMDLSRPLWELHLLDIRTSDAEAVAVLRVHHSAGDRVSLIAHLLASSRKISDQESLPTVPVANGRTPSKHHCISAFLLRFWAVLALLWHSVVDFILLYGCQLFLTRHQNAAQGDRWFRVPPEKIHVPECEPRLCQGHKKCNGLLNNVVVGHTSGGLSRYLRRSFDKSNDKQKKKDLPDSISIRSTLTFNIRQGPGIHALILHFQSYMNKLTMVVAVDELTIPDPHRLLDDLVESLKQTKNAATTNA